MTESMETHAADFIWNGVGYDVIETRLGDQKNRELRLVVRPTSARPPAGGPAPAGGLSGGGLSVFEGYQLILGQLKINLERTAADVGMIRLLHENQPLFDDATIGKLLKIKSENEKLAEVIQEIIYKLASCPPSRS